MAIDSTVELYRVTRDGETRYTGTHDQCFAHILSHQSQSVEWAMKWEGWDIVPLAKHEREVYRRVETYNGEPVYHNEFLHKYHAYPNERGTGIQIPVTHDTLEYVRIQIDVIKGGKR